MKLFLKNIIKLKNWFLLLYYLTSIFFGVLLTYLILDIFDHHLTRNKIIWITIISFIVIVLLFIILLSKAGEKIIRFQFGIKKTSRKLDHSYSCFKIALEHAKSYYPVTLNKVKPFELNTNIINGFGLGIQTVGVTTKAFGLDEQKLVILYLNELLKIGNGSSYILLSIFACNMYFKLLLLILFSPFLILAYLIDVIGNFVSKNKSKTIYNFVKLCFDFISSFWIFIGKTIASPIIRRYCEKADRKTCDLGYKKELLEVLEVIKKQKVKHNEYSLLFSAKNKTKKRIKKVNKYYQKENNCSVEKPIITPSYHKQEKELSSDTSIKPKIDRYLFKDNNFDRKPKENKEFRIYQIPEDD